MGRSCWIASSGNGCCVPLSKRKGVRDRCVVLLLYHTGLHADEMAVAITVSGCHSRAPVQRPWQVARHRVKWAVIS